MLVIWKMPEAETNGLGCSTAIMVFVTKVQKLCLLLMQLKRILGSSPLQ